MSKRPNSVTRTTSSDAVIQTLAWTRKMGFKAVPTHPRSKAAIFKDYAKPGYKTPPDDLWRTHDYGIGVCTGPACGGPVDVDLDCEEALYFARCFFPATAAQFGRSTKRRSHYLYRVDASGFEKQAFIDPVSNSTIIELRGDGGHQTILPGSVHESTGELIEWEDAPFPDVPTLDPELLWKAARKVAIATLISRHIWAPSYHNEPCKHLTGLLFYLDWSLEDVEALLQAVMDYHGDTDKSRLPTIRATYKRGEAGKKISGQGVLRKQLNDDRVVDRLLEWAGSPTINILQEYNDRFAVVSVEGKFRIAGTDAGPGKSPIFYQKEDFLNKMATDYTEFEVDGKVKTVPKAQVWLKSPRRRSYEGVDFLPGMEDDGHTLNLWGGWAVEPKRHDTKVNGEKVPGCIAFIELVYNVICGGNEELAIWLINWFANIIHEPMNKSLTAPVIIGVEGAGKSLMVAYFGAILGPAYTVVTQEKHLTGSFNRHLAGTLLLHSEEALYGGDRKHANIIRSLITDKTRMYEPKGLDAKSVRNHLRLIMLSNLYKAAPAMPGDRRYTVIDMGERKADDELIERVQKELEGDGPAALHQYLLDFEYDPALARKNIKNDGLVEMKTHNLTGIEAWWMDVLMSGTLLPDRLMWAQAPANDAWPIQVGGPALHAAMEVALRDRGTRNIPHPVSFGYTMEKMLRTKLARAQRSYEANLCAGDIGVPQTWQRLNSRQLSIINMPTLEEARLAFDKYIGQKIDWPEIMEDGPQFKKKAEGPEY